MKKLTPIQRNKATQEKIKKRIETNTWLAGELAFEKLCISNTCDTKSYDNEIEQLFWENDSMYELLKTLKGE